MARRRWKLLVFALGVLIVIITAALSLFAPPETTITTWNAGRLQINMTRAEVEAILGPPRVETAETVISVGPIFPSTESREVWVSEEAFVTVGFNQGVVVSLQVSYRWKPSPWQAFIRRVKSFVGL